MLNVSSSSWVKVLSGVPLGRRLLLLFVNDLPDWIKTNIRMFADDTKIWTRILGIRDAESLQRDLDSLIVSGQNNGCYGLIHKNVK